MQISGDVQSVAVDNDLLDIGRRSPDVGYGVVFRVEEAVDQSTFDDILAGGVSRGVKSQESDFVSRAVQGGVQGVEV